VVRYATSTLGTTGIEVKIRVHPGLLLRRCAREGKRREIRPPLLVGAETAQRSAPVRPTRVEADQIELRTNLVRTEERACEHRVVDPGATGTARIQKEEPIRCAGSLAGRRTTAMEIVAPFGLS
jgi:hypothetical protein